MPWLAGAGAAGGASAGAGAGAAGSAALAGGGAGAAGAAGGAAGGGATAAGGAGGLGGALLSGAKAAGTAIAEGAKAVGGMFGQAAPTVAKGGGELAKAALGKADVLSGAVGQSGITGGASSPVFNFLSPQANAGLAKFVTGAKMAGEGLLNQAPGVVGGMIGGDTTKRSFGERASDQLMSSLFQNDQAPPAQVNPSAGMGNQQQQMSEEDRMNMLLQQIISRR